MRNLMGIIGGVGLALAASQAPEFAQQYEQRLGGAVDELRAIMDDFDRTAAENGLNRDEALERYAVNTDSFIVARGADMQDVMLRYENLSAHLTALENASAVSRLPILIQHYDPRIAEAALGTYEPGLQMTGEGLAYAGAGLLGGYGAGTALGAPFARRRRKRQA